MNRWILMKWMHNKFETEYFLNSEELNFMKRAEITRPHPLCIKCKGTGKFHPFPLMKNDWEPFRECSCVEAIQAVQWTGNLSNEIFYFEKIEEGVGGASAIIMRDEEQRKVHIIVNIKKAMDWYKTIFF